jgi:hypothetical protein
MRDDDPEEIFVNETLSKLAPKVAELDQLVSYEPNQRIKDCLEGSIIIRAISSSDPVKNFDDQLSSIRRSFKCGMVTKKVASYLGIHPIHADATIRSFLSNSYRFRINRS